MANVPNVPGVPNLGSYLSGTISLLAQDALTTLLEFLRPQWGLYQDGIPLLPADNVLSFDFVQDWNVSEYPVEQGGFQSYNKVQNPFSVRLRVSVGESEFRRELLLRTIGALADSLDLFDAVTPEETYTNVNIVHYEYRRAAQNVGLIVLDIWCLEIREQATSTFTKSTSAADAKNIGQVQPTAASATQTSSATAVQ